MFDFFRHGYGVPDRHSGNYVENFDDVQQHRLSGFAPRRQYHEGTAHLQSNRNKGSGARVPQINSSDPQPLMPLISGLDEIAIGNFVRLHESGKLEQKTPVSILQELLSCHRVIPSYELVEMEGPLHAQNFYYKVSCKIAEAHFTAKGAGSSKKKAKHSAARALLEDLTGVQIAESETNCSRDANGSFPEDEMTQVDQEPQEQAYDTLDAEQTNSTASSRIYSQQLETIQEEVECECWVQWGCHPAAFCLGWGVTETDAERDAVQNAIEYLKTTIEENDE